MGHRDSGPRHFGDLSAFWILHHSHASPLLHLKQSGGTIVQGSRKDDSDDLRPVGQRRRPEHGVNRRPLKVLARPMVYPHHRLSDD
jgi:hypothetical protein